MDISKICLESSDESKSQATITSSNRQSSLPSISELSSFENVNSNSNNNSNNNSHLIYHAQSIQQPQQPQPQQQYINNNTNASIASQRRYEYIQRYRTQHRYLKSYDDNDFIANNGSSNNECFDNSVNNNLYQQLQPSSAPLLQPSAAASPPFPEENSIAILRNVIDQCTSIYQKMGKYRLDPLTELERSQIVDQVYFTAENVLRKLGSLQEQITANNNNDEDVRDSSMDDEMPLTNNNNNTPQQESPAPNPTTSLLASNANSEEYKMIRQARSLQDNPRPKYRRRSKRSVIGQRCHSCNATETPEWRRGPDGARTLCNACGLHYSKLLRKGSFTVQTHNYMLQGNTRPQPRLIQFPIIQVNKNRSIHTDRSTVPRITEIDQDVPDAPQQQEKYK